MTKIRNTVAIAAINAAALSGGVVAAPARAETFNGPYVGAQIGYNHDRVARSAPDATTLDQPGTKDALNLGVYGGYNFRLRHRIILGAEGGVSFTTSDRITAPSGAATVSIDPQRQFDIGARAGYLVTDKTLLYVRGGYTNLRVRTTDTVPASSTVRDLDGWNIGGGAERAITDHISARVEYRYNHLGREGGRYDRHQVLAGVSYNF